jgi:cob(I)alamin adenosyltransferase
MGMLAVALIAFITVVARVTGIIPTQRDLDAVAAAAKAETEAAAKVAKKDTDDVAAHASRVEGRVDGVSSGLHDIRSEWREGHARIAGRLDTLQATIVTLNAEIQALRQWRHEHGQDATAATVAATALTRQAERLSEMMEKIERRER